MLFIMPEFILLVTGAAAQNSKPCGSGPEVCGQDAVSARNYDGSCNNLKNPRWGSVNDTYQRMMKPNYADGKSSPPRAKSGNELPNPRYVSYTAFPDKGIVDYGITTTAMSLAQILTHDLADKRRAPVVRCCVRNFTYISPPNESNCTAIPLPPGDPVYSPHGAECFPHDRILTNIDAGCSLSSKSAEAVNAMTSYLDLHLIYGLSEQENKALRTLEGGKLKYKTINGQEFFTLSETPESSCSDSKIPAEICFTTGDDRANQNDPLFALHVIPFRNHNKIATEFKKINPGWDDEKLFQESRTILTGMYQHIIQCELFPIYAGENSPGQVETCLNPFGSSNEYDPNARPSAYVEFSQSVWRHFHTLIKGQFGFYNEERKRTGNVYVLKDSYDNVSLLLKGDNFNDFLRGMAKEPAYHSDGYYDSSINTQLFIRKKDLTIGMDLSAIDIARGRDVGVAPYNTAREYCKLTKAKNFTDFQDVMDLKNALLLEEIYEHPDDVDLRVGVAFEKPRLGTLVGETGLCILREQFKNIVRSDRFFYDVKGGPFTYEQLAEIKKVTLARWFCDTSNIEKIQPNVLRTVSLLNPLVPCSAIPKVDLTKWKETTP